MEPCSSCLTSPSSLFWIKIGWFRTLSCLLRDPIVKEYNSDKERFICWTNLMNVHCTVHIGIIFLFFSYVTSPHFLLGQTKIVPINDLFFWRPTCVACTNIWKKTRVRISKIDRGCAQCTADASPPPLLQTSMAARAQRQQRTADNSGTISLAPQILSLTAAGWACPG